MKFFHDELRKGFTTVESRKRIPGQRKMYNLFSEESLLNRKEAGGQYNVDLNE